ncbi:hypothetical protein [Palleronia sp. LCG004]|uniref:hypothetical protein n=1 Tax=Palleronia sp. LCG004 TaxID=3079304 RepID=UPI002943E344|nr:hypothetical protein [Palleronia sp. LCG004]WOI58355.1 hypothetical protein RVY76_18400 [Palleronia sp. LCG004]
MAANGMQTAATDPTTAPTAKIEIRLDRNILRLPGQFGPPVIAVASRPAIERSSKGSDGAFLLHGWITVLGIFKGATASLVEKAFFPGVSCRCNSWQ